MVVLIVNLPKLLPFDTSLPLNQWPNGLGYILPLSFPFIFVVCLLPFYALFVPIAATYMFAKNEMSFKEAKEYVFYSKYPKFWFEDS